MLGGVFLVGQARKILKRVVSRVLVFVMDNVAVGNTSVCRSPHISVQEVGATVEVSAIW